MKSQRLARAVLSRKKKSLPHFTQSLKSVPTRKGVAQNRIFSAPERGVITG